MPETRAQLDFLARENCDEIQGHLIGRAAPIGDYRKLTGAALVAARKTLLAG